MKPNLKQSNKKPAFTIVELLTVMSIIVILIGLLVPALNMAKRYAKTVRQRAQFHSIDAAIELFNNEFDGYPLSGATDPTGVAYCGAMKLCEAMMGQDLLGFHTNSVFRRDGMDAADKLLLYNPADTISRTSRKGPYLPPENANAYRIKDLYPIDSPGFNVFRPDNLVLCDVFTRDLYQVKSGMPILYYKANTTNMLHLYDIGGKEWKPPNPSDDAGNIYNYWDNQELLELGKPWVQGGAGTPAKKHRLSDYKRFYKNTKSDRITTPPDRPYRSDSYILISAGYDGEYGTADDICNFDWKYVE
jgi:type II secretory pathway pseudopilin PulG